MREQDILLFLKLDYDGRMILLYPLMCRSEYLSCRLMDIVYFRRGEHYIVFCFESSSMII